MRFEDVLEMERGTGVCSLERGELPTQVEVEVEVGLKLLVPSAFKLKLKFVSSCVPY